MAEDIGSNARDALAAYVERIEGLLEEKSEVSERIKSEYTAAAGEGFDKKAIQSIIKERAADAQKSIELRAVLDTYRKALAALVGTPLGDWARNWISSDARLAQHKEKQGAEMKDFMSKRKTRAAEDPPSP